MKEHITELLSQAFQKLREQQQLSNDIKIAWHVERTRESQHGDFATNLAMLLAKPLKQNPRQVAEQLIKLIPATQLIKKIEIAGPGFINFYLQENALQTIITTIIEQGANYGRSTMGNGQRIHMEVVSTNPTGPLHVGHGRLAAYCASLANILKAAGYQVHREYYVNDAGRQMQILAVSVWSRYLALFESHMPFPLNGYQGDYVVAIANGLQSEYGDKFYFPVATVLQELPEDSETNKENYVDALILRAKQLLGEKDYQIIFNKGLASIIDDIRDDLQEFGVICDHWFYESELHNNGKIQQGIARLQADGYTYEKDGALWFKATEFGDEKDRVIMRENGQPTYFAADIGYHLYKYEQGYQQILDVMGSDHHGYIPRIKAFLQALQHDVNKLHVQLIQFVVLYRGEEKVSMSTRSGHFVTLRELRNEVGNDAARFFYIMRKHEQHLDFDLDLAKSQSKKNPVYYIQYAHARICSVFRQLAQNQWQWDQVNGLKQLNLLTSENEKNLLRTLARFSEVIESAALNREPQIMANYLQELANDFHVYYDAEQFLVEDVNIRNARLCLITATRQVLANGLELLGLSAPEMMKKLDPN